MLQVNPLQKQNKQDFKIFNLLFSARFTGTLHLKPRASSQLRFKKTEWKQKQCWEAVNSGLSVMENLMNNRDKTAEIQAIQKRV